MKTHSVLNRLLMEFIQGGNGKVDNLLISFSLSSGWGRKRNNEPQPNEMLKVFNLAVFFFGGCLKYSLMRTDFPLNGNWNLQKKKTQKLLML